jgi:hypothetical protein
VFRGEVIYTTDTHQRLLTREQVFQATSRFQNDDAVRFNATETFDRVDRPFEIATGIVVPRGDYQFLDTWGEAETSGKRKVGGRFRVGGGDFYGGTRQYFQMTPAWRPSAYLSFETAYEFNDVDLPQGSFTTHVVNARMNVNLSNRWLTTTLAQYDSASQRHVLYVRLNYIYRPGDDLFIVFNQGRQEGSRNEPDRSLMIKLTYSLDF